MKKPITIEWIIAAGIRALKTFAQTALAMFTINMALNEVDWGYVLSVSAVAAIYSLLTSIVGLPEVGTDGTLQIDTTKPEKDTFRIQLDTPIDDLNVKKKVVLDVDKTAKL